jgi:hypothetical protein
MMKGSAASPSGLEPAAPLPSFGALESREPASTERPMSEHSGPESEILYPTAPRIVSWPRVFPQL